MQESIHQGWLGSSKYNELDEETLEYLKRGTVKVLFIEYCWKYEITVLPFSPYDGSHRNTGHTSHQHYDFNINDFWNIAGKYNKMA